MGELVEKDLVAGFLYCQNKVLLLKRSSSKKFLRGFFERPGGHKEEGESLETAVTRELLEEANLSVMVGTQYFKYTHPINDTLYTEYSFFVKSNQEPLNISLSSEHDLYAWAGIEELDNYKIDPNEKRAIIQGFKNIGSYLFD
jgi:8-oxo-dGTP pyrophosphatase MutT (NUDIX family)